MLRSRSLGITGFVLIALVLVMAVTLTTMVSAQGTATVNVTSNSTLGQILVDSRGMTLYIFTKDAPGVSNCNGTCAQNWPPLTLGGSSATATAMAMATATATAGGTPTAGAGVTGKLGTITRQDGSAQVTYNDMPLYTYIKDTKAGDVNGQGVGGVWFVVNPTSGPVMTATAAATSALATSTAVAPAVVAATPAATATLAAAATTTAVTATATLAANATATPATLPVTGDNQTPAMLMLALLGLGLLGLGFGTLKLARQSRQ